MKSKLSHSNFAGIFRVSLLGTSPEKLWDVSRLLRVFSLLLSKDAARIAGCL